VRVSKRGHRTTLTANEWRSLVAPIHEAKTGSTVLAWSTYAMQRASYAAFSLWIIATVVFVMALVGLSEPEAAWQRIVATLIGAALAIIAGSVAAWRGLLR